MDYAARWIGVLGLAAVVFAGGCRSPYHADRGALLGGLTGAGAGALIGDSVGNAGAGTAIGAGIGALAGGAIGSEMDDMEARNRAMISQQLGRQVAANAVSMDDVVAMTRSGVDDELVVNHIQIHGTAAPLKASDLILLQQQGVSTRVIKAMQTPPARPAVAMQPVSRPVIVEEHHYISPPPYYHRRPRHHCPPSGVSWGMSFHD